MSNPTWTCQEPGWWIFHEEGRYYPYGGVHFSNGRWRAYVLTRLGTDYHTLYSHREDNFVEAKRKLEENYKQNKKRNLNEQD